jgi:hypothetical protein
MTGSNVNFGPPLVRLNPWYPGQFGVPGAWTDTGERLHPTGTVFYVDPNFPGASDGRDGTDPTAPLLTIATAITRCQAYRGDVIAVGANAGWYYTEGGAGYTTVISEEVTVDVPGIKIVGLAPSAMTQVLWTPASDAGTCITVHECDVLIEGFTFSEGGTYAAVGIAIDTLYDGATAFGDSLTVRNCLFDDTVEIGIQVDYAWFCNFHHNIFAQCDTYGIYAPAAGDGVAFSLIHDNQFNEAGESDSGGAMTLLSDSDNNHIYGNAIYNASALAAAAAAGEGINLAAGGGNNMIFNNWFSCLLPVPANGDFDDLNNPGAATNAWVQNFCIDGPTVAAPT